MATETKRSTVDTTDPKANFKRRAAGYVNSAADAITRLGDLAASRTVEYDKAQADRAFAFLQQSLDQAKAKFAAGGKAAKAGFTME